VNTTLFYAQWLTYTTFVYRGEIVGANSAALDAVATMDRLGHFYFVSTRSYAMTFSTIFRAGFRDGHVASVELAPGLSLQQPGVVDFDVEVNASGNALYVSEGLFGPHGGPTSAALVLAMRRGDGFVRVAESARTLATINTGGLNYAAAIGADDHELFFTRIDPQHPGDGPKVYRAYRQESTAPFACPQRLHALTGYVEAPSISFDGHSLYYHKRIGNHFGIYRVTR